MFLCGGYGPGPREGIGFVALRKGYPPGPVLGGDRGPLLFEIVDDARLTRPLPGSSRFGSVGRFGNDGATFDKLNSRLGNVGSRIGNEGSRAGRVGCLP